MRGRGQLWGEKDWWRILYLWPLSFLLSLSTDSVYLIYLYTKELFNSGFYLCLMCTELGGRLQKERHLQKQMPFFLAGYEDSKPLGCLQFTWAIPDRLSGRRRFCAVNPELRQRRRMRRDGSATLTHQKYRRRARSTEANPKTKCDLFQQVAFCFGRG